MVKIKRKKIVTTIDKDGKKVTKEIPYFNKNGYL